MSTFENICRNKRKSGWSKSTRVSLKIIKVPPLGISDFFPLKAAEPMLYKTLICVGLKIDSQNLF